MGRASDAWENSRMCSVWHSQGYTTSVVCQMLTIGQKTTQAPRWNGAQTDHIHYIVMNVRQQQGIVLGHVSCHNPGSYQGLTWDRVCIKSFISWIISPLELRGTDGQLMQQLCQKDTWGESPAHTTALSSLAGPGRAGRAPPQWLAGSDKWKWGLASPKPLSQHKDKNKHCSVQHRGQMCSWEFRDRFEE